MTKDFLLLFLIKARLAEVGGILRGFLPSKSKDDTDQTVSQTTSYIFHISLLPMSHRRILHDLNTGLHGGQAQEGFGQKAAGCDSWRRSDSRDNTVIPGCKKCKKVGRLGLNLAMSLLQNTTQLPGLHKEKHYLVDILTVYFAVCVAENQVLQPTSLHEESLFRLPWKHKST